MEKQIETLDWYVKVVLPSIEAALNTYTSLRPNDFADWMKTDGARMIASIAV